MRSDLSAHRRQGIAWKVAFACLLVAQFALLAGVGYVVVHFIRRWW